MPSIFCNVFLILALFFSANTLALESEWSNDAESQVRLISPITKNNNQNDFYLGLEYKLQDGWKTYWKSPGGGGFPQSINWNKSKNIKDIEILWPTPVNFEILGIQSVGYKDDFIFPLKISLENNTKSSYIFLDINYLVCKDICIPGNASLELFIPAGIGNITKHSFSIEKSLSEIPITNFNLSFLDSATTKIYTDDKNISFHFLASSKKKFKNPSIFLHTKYGLPTTSPQIKLTSDYESLEAIFLFDRNLIKDKEVKAQIIISDGIHSFDLEEIILLEDRVYTLNQSYILILIIAFFGGLILNAMPCVLPVLSIKLLSILNNANNKHSIRKSFLITSFGIIFSFSLLATIFIFFRFLGVSVGWGMQFQQPIFLMIIALILTFFSMNLFGIFEISMPKFLNHKIISSQNLNNNIKDFFNGFFATIMATPCSAPLVGTALTAAFTQSYFLMFLIFIFMGIGMSFPYLLISIFPQLIKSLPKPGKWMKYIKYFLGILLLLTLIWVGNILLNHFNFIFMIVSLFLLIIFLIFNYFFIYRKTTLLLSLVIFFLLPNFAILESTYLKNNNDWLDFNEVNIAELIQEDNIIFVDITADWCATCQYNKINVINSDEIIDYFKTNNIIKIRGDWTIPNEKILNFLEKNNKFGIPFNIIFNKKNQNGIVLSELLSKEEVLKELKGLN